MMQEEPGTDEEERDEEIVLADHDALLFHHPHTTSVRFGTGWRCDA